MRHESTPQGETCKWPESDRPGWVSHLRMLTTTLSRRPRIPICPPASLLSSPQPWSSCKGCMMTRVEVQTGVRQGDRWGSWACMRGWL